jgi:mono/diheme cytochrome c family protein
MDAAARMSLEPSPVPMTTLSASPARWLAIPCLVWLLSGCQQHVEQTYGLSEQTQSLSAELQVAVRGELDKHCGSYVAPKLLGAEDVVAKHLRLGQAVYEYRCAQCHGISGDGQGPQAAAMYPRPRDYRKGIFKFTSTSYGSKPLRSDLVRTLQHGIRGTSMPAFNLLPPDELEAVVDYILTLTRRGELEEQIFYAAEFDEAVNAEAVEAEHIPLVMGRWNAARNDVILPKTPEPELTIEHVRRGRELFLAETTGCKKCHGDDGRGQTPDNLRGDLKDTWGHVTRAADLTSGMLRGGQEPMDVYRRIYGGINGTPMPGFANAFADKPEALWDLVAYVKFISNRRRVGEIPPPGPISPYIPAKPAEPGAAE